MTTRNVWSKRRNRSYNLGVRNEQKDNNGQLGNTPLTYGPLEQHKWCLKYLNYATDTLSYLSHSLADHWGTTVDFTTSFLPSSQFSAFRSMMFHSRPVHSLMLSSHRFLCLPLCLPPWTVPCRIVLASPDDSVMCPYHFSLRLFTTVRRSSYGPMAFPILAFTSSLVTWSLYEIPRSLQKHLISNTCILLSMSAVMVHDSHAYKIWTWPGNASVWSWSWHPWRTPIVIRNHSPMLSW